MCSRIEQTQLDDGSFTSYKITELVNGGFRRVLHSVDDRPAVIKADGTEHWYKDGILVKSRDTDNNQGWFNSCGDYHRAKGLPALVMFNGDKQWFIDGRLHRTGDKPAVVLADGKREWWVDGKRHREDDKPAIIHPNGDQEWWVDGKRHRKEGPAVVRGDGSREWWADGVRTMTN